MSGSRSSGFQGEESEDFQGVGYGASGILVMSFDVFFFVRVFFFCFEGVV